MPWGAWPEERAMQAAVGARSARMVGVVLVFLATGLASFSEAKLPARTGPTIKVLSNQPDLISGGDALVEILNAGTGSLRATLNGADISSAFALRPNGRVMGLVTGLIDGANTLTVKSKTGSATITITNYPNGGPIFSGPQIQPWPCLAGATDAQCNRPVVYDYQYMPSGGDGFQPYDPNNPPSNVGTTTTDQGKTVPYIVRRETGSQDRGQYQIAVLFDPTKSWAPWAPQAGWNGKTYVTGGSGCGTHHGETIAPAVMVDEALKRGFMVWSTALDHNTQNCNLVVQAESMMMAKERIVEQYGPIRYTIGSGCSGGSIYQQQAANDYPGIFDGILPACSFPDSWSTAIEVIDCRLLVDYFDDPSKWAPGVAWPPNQQAAVEGHPGPNICQSWINVYGFDEGGNPRQTNGPTGLNLQSCNVERGVGPDKAYDPQTNPGGVRCDLGSYFVNEPGQRAPQFWGRIEQALGHGLRARLERSNGHHDNQVIWTGAAPLVGDATFTASALTVMNKWLAAIEADTSPLSLATKVVKDKPAEAHDLCTDGAGNELPSASCPILFPYYAEPRMVAGEPFTGDVLKCQLKPIDRNDYATALPPMTNDQFAQLAAIFPSGVCDYSKPGYGQQPTIPWMGYAAGPGGKPL